MPCSKVDTPRSDQPFVRGLLDTATGSVPVVEAVLSGADRLGGIAVRCGIGRYRYTIDPGLYALGRPSHTSPVLVTANYKLTFDALRRRLAGIDAWLLVLDTRGINVWCAAGKGTFSTEELVRRIESSGLRLLVSHSTVVLPQLGATGVSAPDARRASGFRVAWGPVRAADVPAFLAAGMRATPAMRRVTFDLRERAALIPVEAAGLVITAAAVVAGVAFAGGIGPGWFSVDRVLSRLPLAIAAVAAAFAGGSLATPLLLPWLPGRMFSVKGAFAGLALGLAAVATAGTKSILTGMAMVTFAAAGSSFIAMNFTGSSTFTSLHGVEKEMASSMPWQVAGALAAALMWIAGGWS